ncbi:hypothetical protein [Actinomycetospora straminea]|uniref:Uncharacterized protein n=1 Tax=Actinomycetospora straminea TaxID=663607 RepID=A0ABP9EKA7_9PSEU|nr:hypothetical protein [Actinomycetospora straminea]MDD7936465.1 hypothetical protein [Actinomycetospora straminea]
MTTAPGRPRGPLPPAAASPVDRPAPALPADRLLPTPAFPPPRPARDVRATGARLWRRTWPWLAAVAAVVLVVALELGLLQDRIEADLARLHAAGGAPAPTDTVPLPALPPVPVIAPPAAGDVAAVRLRVVDPPCRPGATCTVLVGVDRHPGAVAGSPAWTLLAVDRCRGVFVPLASGASQVTPTASVAAPVPPGRAFALVAVTDGPSRAASPAVPIGAGPC